MHWFDIGVSCALLAVGIWSFFRGVTREVIAILGITATLVLSAWGYSYAARPLEMVIALPWLRQAIGYAVIFLAAVVGYMLLAKAVRRMVEAVGLSLPDRVLGGLFGFVKVGIIVSALVIVLTKFFPTVATQLAAESVLAPTFLQTANLLTTLLPEEVQTDFQRFHNRVQVRVNTWPPTKPTPSRTVRTTPRQPVSATPAVPPSPQAPSSISASDERALRRLIQKRLQDN